jgi:hypothetical protein
MEIIGPFFPEWFEIKGPDLTCIYGTKNNSLLVQHPNLMRFFWVHCQLFNVGGCAAFLLSSSQHTAL